MALGEITSADVAATLSFDELYPNGFPLEQFGADAGISSDPVQEVETRMSLDGFMSAGYTPGIKSVSITFEPNSPCVEYLRTVWQAQESYKRIYRCNLLVRVRATGHEYRFYNGVLKTAPAMSAVGRTLQPLVYTFEFGTAE